MLEVWCPSASVFGSVSFSKFLLRKISPEPPAICWLESGQSVVVQARMGQVCLVSGFWLDLLRASGLVGLRYGLDMTGRNGTGLSGVRMLLNFCTEPPATAPGQVGGPDRTGQACPESSV